MSFYPVAQIHTLSMVACFQMLYTLIMVKLKSSSCKVRHTCIRDTPMREAILQADPRGLLWTIWRIFSHVLIFRTTSIWDCKETLGKEPVSRNVWWIRVNKLRDGILRSGKRLWYSWTTARALPSQNPYTKCMSQYSTWENTKGIFATPYN